MEKAIQYMQIKKEKFSLKGSEVEYTFCKKCGEVSSMKILKPEIFND